MKTATGHFDTEGRIVTNFETFEIVSINEHNESKIGNLPKEFLVGLSRSSRDRYYATIGNEMFPDDENDVFCIVELVDETSESIEIKETISPLLTILRSL